MTDLSSLDRLLERFPEQEPASPLPWHWGNGWDTGTFPAHGDDYAADKYLDCQLVATDGTEVIPILVDHYEAIWDVDDTPSPTAPDRAYLVLAANGYRELRSALVALRQENEALAEKMKGPIPPVAREIMRKLAGDLMAAEAELAALREQHERALRVVESARGLAELDDLCATSSAVGREMDVDYELRERAGKVLDAFRVFEEASR